jgi:hypothetical protein
MSDTDMVPLEGGKFLDLIEEGDELLDTRQTSRRGRQTESPAASTLPEIFQKVRASGWDKPTIQLSALLGMENQGSLSIGGMRRLKQMLASQPTSVIAAALSRKEKIQNDPSFGMLRAWANRNCPVRKKFHRPEKNRIGVGYRDKGSLLPSHHRGRRLPEEFMFYLGEKKEWISSLPQELYIWVQNWSYLLHHLGDGWWAPDTRLRQHMLKARLLNRD